jgi:hypothetical protein
LSAPLIVISVPFERINLAALEVKIEELIVIPSTICILLVPSSV